MAINVLPSEIFTTFTNVDFIDSSQVWTHPSGYASSRKILVVGVGGGGGGGSGAVGHTSSNTTAYYISGGAGGGSGYFSMSSINLITTDLTITVGAGGSGGASRTSYSTTGGGFSSDGLIGSAGGSTSVVSQSGTILTANGGNGGSAGVFSSSASNFSPTPPAGGSGGSNGGDAAYVLNTSDASINITSTNLRVKGGSGTLNTYFMGFFPSISSNSRSYSNFPFLSVSAMSGAGGGCIWKPDNAVNSAEYEIGGTCVSSFPGGSLGGYGGDPIMAIFSSDGVFTLGTSIDGSSSIEYIYPRTSKGEGYFTYALLNGEIKGRHITAQSGGDGIYGGGGGGGGPAANIRTSSYSGTVLRVSGYGGRGGDGAVWVFY